MVSSSSSGCRIGRRSPAASEPGQGDQGLTPLRHDQTGRQGRLARVLLKEPTNEIDWPAGLPAGIRTVVILDD
ncbi:DUF7161 family protein [Micromonospora sp. CA-259024]|uniref:DUF7161 family protein n=1 Tax=Micromonospora sp. CA-259024 TaxID=3239965 RepID=UPI003D8E5C1E